MHYIYSKILANNGCQKPSRDHKQNDTSNVIMPYAKVVIKQLPTTKVLIVVGSQINTQSTRYYHGNSKIWIPKQIRKRKETIEC